jgi:hypothetical protein
MSQIASTPSERVPKNGGVVRVVLQLAFVVWLAGMSIATLVLNYPAIADPIGAKLGISPETMESFRAPFKRPDIF